MKRNTLTTLALLIAAPGLFAQETTGSVVGTVKDSAGKPLAGVTLKLSATQLLGERVVVTGPEGTFRLPILPSGNYTMVCSREGYLSAKAEFRLSAGSVLRQDVTLRPIPTTQAQAVVEVIAAAAQVDKSETTTKTTFTTDQIAEITGTGAGSAAYGVLGLSPGVTGGVQNASIRGGGQQAANYVVNGVSSKDNVTAQGRMGDYVLDDSIEDAAVIQSPLNAKNGGSSSGILAVVTKRGTNEFTGVIRAKLTNPAWAALATPFRNRRGQLTAGADPAQGDDMNRIWEITVGGPIIKDKLTFFYGTRLRPQTPNTAVAFPIDDYNVNRVVFNGQNLPAERYQTGQVYGTIQKQSFHQYALFYQITPDHSLEYNYSEGHDVNPDLQYNSVTPDISLSPVQTSVRMFYTMAYRGIIGSNGVLEVRYGRNRSDTQFQSGPGVPIQVLAGSDAATTLREMYADCEGAFNISPMTVVGFPTEGGASDVKPDERTTESLWANYNLQLEWNGNHNIDVGFDRQQPIWGTVSRSNSYPTQFFVPGRISTAYGDASMAGKYIVFPYNADIDGEGSPWDTGDLAIIPKYTVFRGAASSKVRNPTTAVFLNDLWTVNSKWSVMLGLRYEMYKLEDALGVRVDSKSISPRFEVKWDVNGDQKRLVNFSYGQFRGFWNARFYRAFTEGRLNNQYDYYWNKNNPATGLAEQYLVPKSEVYNTANYGFLGSFTTAAAWKVDKSLKPEVNTEMVLGYRRAYDNGGFWRAAAIYRKWTDLVQPLAQRGVQTIHAPEEPSLTQTTWFRLLTNDPDIKRDYKALEFEFMVPVTRTFTIGGNYTFTRLTGNDNLYGDTTGYGTEDGFGSMANAATTGTWAWRFHELGYSDDYFRPNGQLGLSRNHMWRFYATLRMDSAKIRSSISLQGNYLSGTRVNATNRLSMSANNLISGGVEDTWINYVSIYKYWNGRGQFSNPDTWALNLQYNIEYSLTNRVRLFSQLTINNVLNSFIPSTLSRSALTGPGDYGFKATSSAAQNFGSSVGTITQVGAGVIGQRNMNIDLGIRF